MNVVDFYNKCYKNCLKKINALNVINTFEQKNLINISKSIQDNNFTINFQYNFNTLNVAYCVKSKTIGTKFSVEPELLEIINEQVNLILKKHKINLKQNNDCNYNVKTDNISQNGQLEIAINSIDIFLRFLIQ